MHPALKDDLTPPYGLPAKEALKVALGKTAQHDSDISGLKSALQTVANEVGELRGDVAEVKGIAIRVEASLTHRPSLPPMRAELPSHVNVHELAKAITEAAIKGERQEGTTAEAEVEAVIDRVQLLQRGRLFNKIVWLALAGAGSIAAERIVAALLHH